jgi:uncharacterized membrane protein YccC
VSISALIVLLISITGLSPKEVIVARGINTIAGGALALVAYLVWPTWERSRLPDLFAALLDAYENSFRSVFQKLLYPASASASERERTRQASRTARSNLETSIERLAAEPGISAEQLAQANAMLAASHRFAHALIALEAGIPETGAQSPQPQFKQFAEAIEKTLELLSAYLRGEGVVEREFPDLREVYSSMAHQSEAADGRYGFVMVEADRMVNSLNTLREQVFAWKRSLAGTS